MIIRKTTTEDIPRLREIFESAKRFMRERGNPSQWDESYPPEEMLLRDIEREQSYVIEADDGHLAATFVYALGDEPHYRVLDEGAWLNDDPYGTIHRIATDGTLHGLTAIAVDYCRDICPNVKLDTHPDNLPMQKAAETLGFTRCGMITLEDGSRRILYHRDFRDPQAS